MVRRNRNQERERAATRSAPAAAAQARAATPERERPAQAAGTTTAPQQTTAPSSDTASSPPVAQASNGALTQRSMAAPPAVNERNAFEAYGQAMNVNNIVGTLIKFSKGDWVTGDDEDVDEDVLNGVVVNMDQLMVGWIKWVDNRPSEQIMGTVASGYQAPKRSELGDTDQAQWESDDQGRPRDPWQFSNYALLKTPGEEATQDDMYTFATSSKGGLNAIGKLCRDFGQQMRARPDEFPIVKLGADHYQHPTFGRTYVPMIQIIGWEKKSLFAEISGQSEGAPSSEADAAA